jgi:uncharacterized protein involved in exopolysaccharide biosynthesis
VDIVAGEFVVAVGEGDLDVGSLLEEVERGALLFVGVFVLLHAASVIATASKQASVDL